MTDRRRRPVVLLLAIALAAGCLPDSVGPSRGPASAGPLGPTATPAPSGPTPVPSFVRPTPTPMPTFLSYTVARGDSLTSIARRFATTPRSIAFWNRSTHPSLDPLSAKYSPNRITVGWILLLIPGVVFDEDSLPDETPTPEPTEDVPTPATSEASP